MSNTIKIKRGASAPSTANLQSYELGFDTTNKILYINNNGTITKIGNQFVGDLLTASSARNALGLGNTTGAVPIANGGTGATSAAAARTNLGITLTNLGAAPSTHNHTKSQITDFSHTHVSGDITNWDSFLEMIFPIGAIYISTGDSPAALFSYQTEWEKITDRFLVGAGNSYAVGATGGAAEVTLTEAQVPKKTYGMGVRPFDYGSNTDLTVYGSTNVTTNHLNDWGSWYGLQSSGHNRSYYTWVTWNYGGGGGTHQHTSVLRRDYLQKSPVRKRVIKGIASASVGRWANG